MDIYGDLPPSPRMPTPTSDAATTTTASSSTSTTAPTLDQELDAFVNSFSNVGASLGSFWGNVRKQSQTAYTASKREFEALNEAAKKDFTPLLTKAKTDLAKVGEDLSPYMVKAREELNKLGEQARNSAAAGQAVATGSAPPPSDSLMIASSSASTSSSDTLTPDAGSRTEGEGEKTRTGGDISFYGEVMTSPNSGTAPPLPDEASPQFNTLLHKMQSLQSQIQANPSIAQLSKAMPNLSQIQANISQLQARLPDQVQRSEAYLNRATKEFSDLLNSAVKVVPPSPADLAVATSRGNRTLTRKEGLLHRLRTDSAVMLVDPAQPPAPSTPVLPSSESATAAAESEAKEEVKSVDDFKARTDAREDFATFLQGIEKEGGFEGEAWQARVAAELALGEGEGAALSASLASLVPEKMPAEAFWTRYFFRVHQIDEDDARRRQVLEGAAQSNEDDFSWDVEDENTDSPKDVKVQATAEPVTSTDTSPDPANVPSVSVSGPASTTQGSGRNSSEEGTAMSTSSYDVVSRTVSESEKPAAADEDEDSDWE